MMHWKGASPRDSVPQNYNFNLATRKHKEKQTPKQIKIVYKIPTNKLQSVKVIKVKERLRNCHCKRLKTSGQLNKIWELNLIPEQKKESS